MTCTSCKTDKPDDKYRQCAPCRERRAAYMRQYVAANPAVREASNRRAKAAHGGCCAICRTDKPGGGKSRLAVDHDHKTGRVRAILCQRCNMVVGALEGAHASGLIDYVRRHHEIDRPTAHSEPVSHLQWAIQ